MLKEKHFKKIYCTVICFYISVVCVVERRDQKTHVLNKLERLLSLLTVECVIGNS